MEQDPYAFQEDGAVDDEEARRQQLAVDLVIADFMWMMNDARGRRIVWRQLADAGVFRSSFSPDAMQMAFNEGRRDGGLKLLAQIDSLCPEHYSTMMKENT